MRIAVAVIAEAEPFRVRQREKTNGHIEPGNRGREEALASITAREKVGGFVVL